MTAEEKKAILDAVNTAESRALAQAEALGLPPDAEMVLLKLAAQIRAAVQALDATAPST